MKRKTVQMGIQQGWCDGSAQLSALIDIHRQHGKQCHESNQGKQLLSEATHNHIRLLRVNGLSLSFLFSFRFDILVNGYNSLDRNSIHYYLLLFRARDIHSLYLLERLFEESKSYLDESTRPASRGPLYTFTEY